MGLVILFTLLDPAPSRGLSLPVAFAFWLIHIFTPLALAQFTQSGLMRVLPRPSHVWGITGLAGILAGLLFMPVSIALDRAFFGANTSPDNDGIWGELWGVVPPVALVWLGLNAARFLRLPERSTPVPAVDQLPFMNRLPNPEQGDLIAVSAELHYLRVYTHNGDGLILYSFGQAMADLAQTDGLQIHRSHWVATGAVTKTLGKRRKLSVALTNGLVRPVARNREAAVLAKFANVS